MRRIVITADDFGFSESVNEAVERGFRDGVLRSASLMVSAPAAADAIARARRLPGLRVGLHVTVVQGVPVLPTADIPHLVDGDGRFPDDLLSAALGWFFHGATRRELGREIAAQFAAFRATGLSLDHVDVHNHMHLHPSVLSEIIANLAPGEAAVRLPREPLAQAGVAGVLLAPWIALMRARLRRAGLAHNDWLLGIRDSGRVDEACLLAYLEHLPAGKVEIHLHPAVTRDAAVAAAMPGYFNEAECAALQSAAVAARLRALAIEPGGFSDLFDAGL
jgi:hopanoid biosynthesis associated protein HpnK